jgi:hypothetical protein
MIATQTIPILDVLAIFAEKMSGMFIEKEHPQGCSWIEK